MLSCVSKIRAHVCQALCRNTSEPFVSVVLLQHCTQISSGVKWLVVAISARLQFNFACQFLSSSYGALESIKSIIASKSCDRRPPPQEFVVVDLDTTVIPQMPLEEWNAAPSPASSKYTPMVSVSGCKKTSLKNSSFFASNQPIFDFYVKGHFH